MIQQSKDKHYTLNATAASLLGFLHEGPMTGWDIVATAENRIGNFWSLTRSQVYRELNNLAKAELITAGERGERDKRLFTLTIQGRQAFTAWILQEPREELIRFPLLLTTSFTQQIPSEQLLQFIFNHRKIHTARLKQYEKEYAELPEAELTDGYRLTLLFGINYENMVLQWMIEVIKITNERKK
jgi:DNA-binding PadR family transcriptional regulator